MQCVKCHQSAAVMAGLDVWLDNLAIFDGDICQLRSSFDEIKSHDLLLLVFKSWRPKRFKLDWPRDCKLLHIKQIINQHD